LQARIGTNGVWKTINWDGCIEERQTVVQSSYSPIPSGAKDLDIDLVPSTSDSTTQWGPMLPDLVYTYGSTNTSTTSWSYTGSTLYTSTTNYAGGDAASGFVYDCPQEARKLQSWTDPTVFDSYVDSLAPGGNTYHDIGLVWGARLMSPTGIFASENALTPQGGQIERHMIFMTDGDACTNTVNYHAYGLDWYDRRLSTPQSTDPGKGSTCSSDTDGPLTQQVEQRTAALCTAIKNKNITLWVIYFGTPATANIQTAMTNCASPGRFFVASNAAALQQQFASIANQISQLRLTR
jgi:hypothetical protein